VSRRSSRGRPPLALAAGTFLLAVSALIWLLAPAGPPSPATIRAYACQHPSDAVLEWAESQGVLVHVRECPQEEK